VVTDCQEIQEMLTEHFGEVDRLDGTVRQHVDSCPGCREVAAAEYALAQLLAEAIPPADPSIERGVRAALRPVRVRRRIVALLPVAASLMVTLLGAMMVGGVPGGGMIGLLPIWSAQGWMSLAAGVSDWGTVVVTGTKAAGVVLDPAIFVGAALLSLLGLVVVSIAALRWRRVSPWRGDS
jgi:hypothetical protein